jgi:hypothetical protein
MSYYSLNSYCTPKPYTVVDPHKHVGAGLEISWKKEEKTIPQSPVVFGPAMWFSFHVGSANLPKVLSPVSVDRIKSFINGIPEMVPCTECSEHARAFIERSRERINNFKFGDDVFRFYVDFHNYVNERLDKRQVSYEEAYKMYKGGMGVNIMKY